MKTGKEVLERAMQLLGYTNSYGEVDGTQEPDLLKRGTAAVQQIFDDLQGIEHPSTYDTTPLQMNEAMQLQPKTINDVMPYGVAMLLAQNIGDNTQQSLFADLYNTKRTSVKRPAITRTDVISMGGY